MSRPFDSILGVNYLVPGRPFKIGLGEVLFMFLLYLDESGDPNSWQSQTCYVIGGVAVHEGQVHGLSSQLDNLQSKYFPGIQIPIPFHATEIRRGKGHFKGFLPDFRNQILGDVYAVIGNAGFPNLVVFATAIDISAARNPTQARRDVFEDVCEKFNGFLVHQYRRGNPVKGLLLIDENREAEYRELLSDFRRGGTTHGYLGNVIDIPYFARCHQTRMLQLADFVANAIFRYYEHDDRTNLDIILSRFYTGVADRKGLSAGFGHIVDKVCTCMVCSERNSR